MIWRGLWRLAKLLLVAAIAVAAAPVTLIAAGSAATAWWRGWPPRRLYVAAAWCLPMALVWLVAVAVWPRYAGPAWFRVVAAPYRSWATMWLLLRHGRVAAAAAIIAPIAVPLGLLAGGAAWAYRIFRLETGAAGLSPAAPARFDARLWRRQVRTARGLLAAPGALPLFRHNGGVIIGAVIRAVGHRQRPVASIPYQRLRSHQVVIGTTGTGKTTLLLRLWAGFMTGGLRGYVAGASGRPLLVVLDCKGGASSRKVADRFRRVLRDAGARSVATWPDETALRLWDLPPGQLISTLLDLIEHGSGAAAYYADVMEALVALAVNAPCGPPAGYADFLSRLDAGWLLNAYSGGEDAEAIGILRSAGGMVADTALRFRTLWRRLGDGFDGGSGFGDADAWYCVLEGTADTAVAEAQARALVDLLATYAVSGANREILLAVDEFSAVSRRLPIWQLYERARSLGLAVQVSAQSWEGLAEDEDQRYRIAATAEGGIWLLRTPHPGPVVELAGNRRVVDTSRRLTGDPGWDATGTSRSRQVPVLDPDLVRRLDVGQVAYVYRGGVTFVQVKRLIGGQAALTPAPPVVPAPRQAPEPAATAAGPDGLREFLDATFGEIPGAGG
ncbi:MAG: hypothetical protein ABSA93_06215 [Streptosporangiaceae bacterium]